MDYRLPDDTRTNSQDEYLQAWVGLGRKIEDVLAPLGYRLGAFDPEFSFFHDKLPTVNIPPSAAIAFAKQGENYAAILPLAVKAQREAHYAAVASHPMFSTAHWQHNAGREWPETPDDDSYTAFENCKHPDCAMVRGHK